MRRSPLCAVLSAILLSSFTHPAQATRYVFSTFKGDTAPGEKLSIYVSEDGLNFTLLSDTGYAGGNGTLRDPSIMRHSDGKYYVAHTSPPTASCCGKQNYFSVSVSSDLVRWSELAKVPAGVPGVAHAWAPEWFVDDDGVHVIANVDTLNNDSDFKPYVYTAKDNALTSWSGPVPLGFGPNYIDTFVMRVGNVYHAFTKNEGSRYLEHATAARLAGPWTFVGTGNWSGFGTGMEGPNVVRLDNGMWRIYLDGQGAVGFLYADSADLMKWSPTKPLPALSNLVRHGTIIRDVPSPGWNLDGGSGEALADAGAPNDGGARGDATPGDTPPDGDVSDGSPDPMPRYDAAFDHPPTGEMAEPPGPVVNAGGSSGTVWLDAETTPPRRDDPPSGCACRVVTSSHRPVTGRWSATLAMLVAAAAWARSRAQRRAGTVGRMS